MRRYYLHRRKDVYYVELVTHEGHKLTAKSTGKTTKDEALLVVSKWLADGIPQKGAKDKPLETVMGLDGILKAIRRADLDGADAIKIVNALKERDLIDCSIVKAGSGARIFTEFLEEFWDYTSSPYIAEKKAIGKPIGKRHAYEAMNCVHGFYDDYFADRPLNSITRHDLKKFALFLAQERKKPEGYRGRFAEKLSAAYRNKILVAGLTALRWAFQEDIIPVDPTARFKRFSGETKKRGILTQEEAKKLFVDTEWKDKRAFTASLVACTSGARSGEILALRKSDIDNMKGAHLHIGHSWSNMDGLKTPKNGDSRKVYLYPEVKAALLELLASNPHTDNPDPFIFYSSIPNKPVDGKILLNGLQEVCTVAKIDHKSRNILFHGWRHYFTTHMADKIEPERLQRITGHKTKSVFEEYANHEVEENLDKIGEIGVEVFGNILQFRKAG